MSQDLLYNNISRTRSQLSEMLLRIDGKPVDIRSGYPMFLAIYDGSFQRTLLKTCRQVGKSTTLSNFSIVECVAVPFFKQFFIAPSQEQTQKYSTGRVGKTITYSPLIRKHFVNQGVPQRVLSRMFTNGSEINFSYAEDDADRCRGISADRLCLDEVQDMLLDAVVPVVKECLSNSGYKYETYCGTPKTNENAIENLWKVSTQTEWVIKCDSCGRSSIIVSEKQLSPQGPICTGCQGLLNPRNGRWVDMNPQPKNPKALKGFHISRPIMPKNVPAAWPVGPLRDKALDEWLDVYDKLAGPKPYPLAMFRNEVLGVSDSQGRRIVTLETLQEMCDGPPMSPVPTAENMKGVVRVTAGIDWSGGGTQLASRTVLCLLGKVGETGKLRVLYYKIFPGTSPVEEVNEIAGVLQQYNRNGQLMVGVDRGEGNMPSDMLRRKFGDPRKVVKIHYTGSLSSYIKWNADGFYVLHRTHAIDSLMSALNRREFQFNQNQASMAPAFQDILSEYEEVTREGRKRWDHAATEPDDFLHALNFARVIMQVVTNEVNLTA